MIRALIGSLLCSGSILVALYLIRKYEERS
jgi:hypothetical protein